MSGFEWLAEWRASSRRADMPMFVLTRKDLSPEGQSDLHLHAESLLHKQQPWQELMVKQLRRIVP